MALVPTRSSLETADSAKTRLEQVVAGWLLSYSSANTRAAYRLDLHAFTGWLDEHQLGLLDVRRPHVDAWARTLEHAGYRPSTVARRLASIASFYRYAETIDAVTHNPAVAVRRPRTGERHVELTPALDRSELQRVLHAATEPHDKVLVLLLALLGLRVSEALALDHDDIETIRGHHTVLIAGKGAREDRMPLPPAVCDAIYQLATTRTDRYGPILRSATGERMSRHGAARALARLGRKAGLTRPLHPHMLRATAITAALEAGATLRDTQDFARHNDPRTTRRYDRARSSLDRHAAYTIATWLATTRE